MYPFSVLLQITDEERGSEGFEMQEITSLINRWIIYLQALSAPAPAQDKSQILTHQQQIVSGVPFISHHMPSYSLQQRRAPSGWTGGQNPLTSSSS